MKLIELQERYRKGGCMYCKKDAVKGYKWCEGRAVIWACKDHLEKARKKAEANNHGEHDGVMAVNEAEEQPQPPMPQQKDATKLQPYQVDEIRKKIREGAKDIEQKWANALELVHKAYEVTGNERPTPLQKDLWKTYEDMISFATKELANVRGIDGDWRMTSVDN